MSDAPDDADDPESDADGDGADAGFERELSNARALLAGDDLRAVHVGVVRGGEVETAVARGGDGDQTRLRALTLLAAHLRTVAAEAGVDPGTLAADAARLAGEMEAP
ncbi:hypothetical protein, partial [Candidatus Halobonum tyrrellensis]